MSSFKNKKVLIFGLGLNDGGLGMAEFFLNAGAIVTITDCKTEEQLAKTLDKLKQYKNIVYHLGGHIKEDFIENDIIIRNPAIKRDNEWLEIARKNGKIIEMEMSLFHKLAKCPIIGVTGTRGKSTTTTLAYEFLKEELGDKVFLGGNIGRSAIREVNSLTAGNLAILELSSFQLDAMGESKVSPHVALVTNMYPDHLNWHVDMNDYIETKKNIFRNQKGIDFAIINVDNEITKEFAKEIKSNLITFSLKNSSANYYYDNEKNIIENGKILLNIKDSLLEGEHNEYNILGAVAIARVYGIKAKSMLRVLKRFIGVAGRQELVTEVDGVKFYNDTTATSLEAVIAALNRFGTRYKGKIVMISGGMDKGLDYVKVRPLMEKYLKALILLKGTASEKIYDVLKDSSVRIEKYFGVFKDAILKAKELATVGDMVILCPGAASFNMFANEFDRGEQFNEVVTKLKHKTY